MWKSFETNGVEPSGKNCEQNKSTDSVEMFVCLFRGLTDKLNRHYRVLVFIVRFVHCSQRTSDVEFL